MNSGANPVRPLEKSHVFFLGGVRVCVWEGESHIIMNNFDISRGCYKKQPRCFLVHFTNHTRSFVKRRICRILEYDMKFVGFYHIQRIEQSFPFFSYKSNEIFRMSFQNRHIKPVFDARQSRLDHYDHEEVIN